MFSPKRNSLLVLSLATFTSVSALTLAGCKKDDPSKLEATRVKWIESPTRGKRDGEKMVFEELGVSFEKPEVAYVYRECAEASHSPAGPDKDWIPVMECYGGTSESESEDDYEDEDLGESSDDFGGYEGAGGNVMRLYATKKSQSINERTVETMRSRYQNEGYVVDNINYHDDYLNKEGRRGISVVLHVMNTETGYPEREIKRFFFPRGKVLFVMEVDYPFGADRSGIDGDWQRILWNIEFTEDLEKLQQIDEAEEMEEQGGAQ